MKRALVTGGSGDIGSAICRSLAATGFEVIVHAGRRMEVAEQLVTEISEQGGAASALQFDVTDADASRQAIEFLLADGPIQVLVSNAGIHDDGVLRLQGSQGGTHCLGGEWTAGQLGPNQLAIGRRNRCRRIQCIGQGRQHGQRILATATDADHLLCVGDIVAG